MARSAETLARYFAVRVDMPLRDKGIIIAIFEKLPTEHPLRGKLLKALPEGDHPVVNGNLFGYFSQALCHGGYAAEGDFGWQTSAIAVAFANGDELEVGCSFVADVGAAIQRHRIQARFPSDSADRRKDHPELEEQVNIELGMALLYLLEEGDPYEYKKPDPQAS